jgi:hypothetical protein
MFAEQFCGLLSVLFGLRGQNLKTISKFRQKPMERPQDILECKSVNGTDVVIELLRAEANFL